jgi:hypothetical protein
MVARREAGHDYPVQLVCGLDIQDADDPSLAGMFASSFLYASARVWSLSSRRKNLPVAVLGSSSMTSTCRGYL